MTSNNEYLPTFSVNHNTPLKCDNNFFKKKKYLPGWQRRKVESASCWLLLLHQSHYGPYTSSKAFIHAPCLHHQREHLNYPNKYMIYSFAKIIYVYRATSAGTNLRYVWYFTVEKDALCANFVWFVLMPSLKTNHTHKPKPSKRTYTYAAIDIYSYFLRFTRPPTKNRFFIRDQSRGANRKAILLRCCAAGCLRIYSRRLSANSYTHTQCKVYHMCGVYMNAHMHL